LFIFGSFFSVLVILSSFHVFACPLVVNFPHGASFTVILFFSRPLKREPLTRLVSFLIAEELNGVEGLIFFLSISFSFTDGGD